MLLLDVSLLLENYTFLLEFLIFTKLLFHSFTAADGHSSCAWRNMHCIRDIGTLSSRQSVVMFIVCFEKFHKKC